jgi:hypothetical protein
MIAIEDEFLSDEDIEAVDVIDRVAVRQWT